MKSHLVAAVMIGLCVWSLGAALQAELFIEETFTGYKDNVLISASPAGGATGLIGDWSLVTNNDFYVNMTQADSNAGTGKAVYDRSTAVNGTRTATRNAFVDPVDPDILYQNDGDVFYASFLIDPPKTNGQMTFELGLIPSAGGGAKPFLFGINGGQYIVGTSEGNAPAFGGPVITGGQLVLVRVEYGDTITGGADDDEIVTLWVNPTDESSTPVIDNFNAEDILNSGGGIITSVSMRGGNMLGAPAFFDNLRVGTTFAEVVPEPSTLTLLALGLALLIPVARRRR